MKNRIIFYSGGRASFAIADYVKTHFPDDNIVLYFSDTLWEDEDLYRFLNEGADKLELPLLTHIAGVNPLELSFESKLVLIL
jgi:3'-phosphoadenosine 5'-phosphosulfate sulfotransferase (PAPS reductase)/FAD synthetase